MRSDAILHAAVPLLALVLLATAGARGPQRLLQPVRAAALAALAGASAAVLMLRAGPSSPVRLEPFALAAACVLVGWLVLREGLAAIRAGGAEPSVVALLTRAAAAVAVGVGAAALALLSRAPAAWLGLVGDPTIYALCILSGLFVRYALKGATILQVALAACAWLSVAGRSAAPDGPVSPAMLLLFLVPALSGAIWRRKIPVSSAEHRGVGDKQRQGKGRRRKQQSGVA